MPCSQLPGAARPALRSGEGGDSTGSGLLSECRQLRVGDEGVRRPCWPWTRPCVSPGLLSLGFHVHLSICWLCVLLPCVCLSSLLMRTPSCWSQGDLTEPIRSVKSSGSEVPGGHGFGGRSLTSLSLPSSIPNVCPSLAHPAGGAAVWSLPRLSHNVSEGRRTRPASLRALLRQVPVAREARISTWLEPVKARQDPGKSKGWDLPKERRASSPEQGSG